jgi:hypothetical protein
MEASVAHDNYYWRHIFYCNGCGSILSDDKNEERARIDAHKLASKLSWYWSDNGAEIYCPRCWWKGKEE